MRAGGGYLAGHLGNRVSALLDGRLAREEADRAWAHVHLCAQCRAVVEREGWVKTRLAGLSPAGAAGPTAPASLKGALAGLTPGDLRVLGAAPLPTATPTSTGARRGYSNPVGAPPQPAHHGRGLAAFGGGALGAAVLGVLALGAAPLADAPTVGHDVISPASAVSRLRSGPVESDVLEQSNVVSVGARIHR